MSKLMFSDGQRSVSRTQQHYKKSCDVNNIIAKYRKTGILDGGVSKPVFGDFSELGDFHAVANKVIEAQLTFQSLPGKIRDMFHGDVGALIEFVNDPANAARCRELGLLPQLTAEELAPVEAVVRSKEAAGVVPAGTAPAVNDKGTI